MTPLRKHSSSEAALRQVKQVIPANKIKVKFYANFNTSIFCFLVYLVSEIYVATLWSDSDWLDYGQTTVRLQCIYGQTHYDQTHYGQTTMYNVKQRGTM